MGIVVGGGGVAVGILVGQDGIAVGLSVGAILVHLSSKSNNAIITNLPSTSRPLTTSIYHSDKVSKKKLCFSDDGCVVLAL